MLVSIERCFELGARDVVAGAVEAVLVEPVHSRRRGEFELVDVVSGSRSVGFEHALDCVEPDHRLIECVNGQMESFWARTQVELPNRKRWNNRLRLTDAMCWV